ncbi:MAG: glutamate--tRNA ligase [Thermoplasmata archaeon]|nr:MAG: glutamate--tRNA ligase [Thermoplasmata archaeon]
MLEELIRKYALQNAILHDGKADEKSVLGKVISAKPELKSEIKDIMKDIKTMVTEVNGLSIDEQMKLLEKEAPELLERKVTKKMELSDLPNVEGKVVMRFAPGPSGPLHIGHTRAAVLNDEYVKRYGGKYIIRLEDTNPAKIEPEAYDSIIEDLKWLGVDYHEFGLQSDRFEIYYEHAKRLLEMGKAYICICDVEDWRSAKLKMKPCPHRGLEVEAQLEMWDGMLAGSFDEHEASYVVKTDLLHPNPAVRDFVGLRIVKSPHPKTGDKYLVYPLYNFSVAIDDYLMGMTHVLRGKDHLNNTYRQEFIYDHFGWKKPIYVHYGLVQMVDTTLKTTVIKEGIKKGEFSGWDDVRLATLKTMARRGISAKAIRQYWIEVGIKEVDIKFSWDNLYAYNKDIVDDEANRYFFVWNPRQLIIFGEERLEGHAPLHPDHPERGIRKIVLEGKDGITVFVTEDDIKKVKPEEKLRLKDLCNIKIISQEQAEYKGDDLSILKEGVKIIHWVGEENIPTKLYLPDGSVKEGICERILEKDIGSVVQFERFGFIKVEQKEGGYEAYFAHR